MTDPNVNLREQFSLARGIVDTVNPDDAAYRLAELVLRLDEWIVNGGSLPERWKGGR